MQWHEGSGRDDASLFAFAASFVRAADQENAKSLLSVTPARFLLENARSRDTGVETVSRGGASKRDLAA